MKIGLWPTLSIQRGVFNVANFTERHKSKFIYISTAYVFSGEEKVFLEEDTPVANSIYGKSKNLAEFFIQKNCFNYLILRCCDLYGRGILLERPTWFELLQEKLFRGEGISTYGNVKVGFLDIVYLAMIVKICIEREVNNKLFHVCSTDIMSQYEFSLEYVDVFDDKKGFNKQKSLGFPPYSIDDNPIQFE